MNAQTLTKMKQMKLHGIASTISANVETGKWEKHTPDELIALFIEAEWDERHNRKLDRSLKQPGSDIKLWWNSFPLI